MNNSESFPPRIYFETPQGNLIPSVTEDEMREVDRIAEEEFSLSVLQMMENAGRNLALHSMQLSTRQDRTLILAGPGGNGGGGMSCMRHLHNHGFQVDLLLTKPAEILTGPALMQYKILDSAGLHAQPIAAWPSLLSSVSLIIDALLGYSLQGAPRGVFHDLIQGSNESSLPILSLDLPSGLDATTGNTPGIAISPIRTLTLALPKRGLHEIAGSLFLSDIGIPPELYQHIGLALDPIFSGIHWLELHSIGHLSD